MAGLVVPDFPKLRMFIKNDYCGNDLRAEERSLEPRHIDPCKLVPTPDVGLCPPDFRIVVVAGTSSPPWRALVLGKPSGVVLATSSTSVSGEF